MIFLLSALLLAFTLILWRNQSSQKTFIISVFAIIGAFIIFGVNHTGPILYLAGYTLVLVLLAFIVQLFWESNRLTPGQWNFNREAKEYLRKNVNFADPLLFPGYHEVKHVGSGGMANVYRAFRDSDGQVVALKIPVGRYGKDEDYLRRFHREAEVVGYLDHNNIVKTFKHGVIGVKHYVEMEFIEGRSLDAYIESKELNVGTAIEITKLLISALNHIHGAGVIHRDIKPSNIMIKEGGFVGEPSRVNSDAVKLMDFGIAGGKDVTSRGFDGQRGGTPIYMSPEQARGLEIDHRSDIYSLGLVLYEMLTNQTAFGGISEVTGHQQGFQVPPSPRQVNYCISGILDHLVMRMIAKDPNERPALREIQDTLLRDDVQDVLRADLTSQLVLIVSSHQGVVRILDSQGAPYKTLGDIGVGPRSFTTTPMSVSVDSNGNYFLAVPGDRLGSDRHHMIHKLAPDGTLLDAFGVYGMSSGELLQPVATAVIPDDSVLVLDSETHLVQRFSHDGEHLSSFGGRGTGNGLFNNPRDLCVGPDGSVYVLDYGNRQIQEFTVDGIYATRWAFFVDSEQDRTRLLDGLTVDKSGNLYVSDVMGGRVRLISPEGKVVRSYPIESVDGDPKDTLIDLGVDVNGILYAVRRGGHLIRKLGRDSKLLDSIEVYSPVMNMIVNAQ